ncbi:MAG: hypothetical protein ACLR53_11535 [Evtepia gabavorous]
MKQEERSVQFHIQCAPGDVGRYCILPGDPGRSEIIARYFDNPIHVAYNREFNIYTGTLLGEKVSVCSTGIGGPSAVIALEELCAIGGDTFVRTGTCGGIKLEVQSNDLVTPPARSAMSQPEAPIELAVPDMRCFGPGGHRQALGHPWHAGWCSARTLWPARPRPDAGVPRAGSQVGGLKRRGCWPAR